MFRKMWKGFLCSALAVSMMCGGSALTKAAQKVKTSKSPVTALLLQDKKSVDQAEKDKNDATRKNWISGNAEKGMTVQVNTAKTGYLYVNYISQDAQGKEQEATVSIYKGKTASGKALVSHTNAAGTISTPQEVAKGTYTVSIKAAAGKAYVYPYYYTTQDIGMTSTQKVVRGNGKTMYQSFKVSKKRQSVSIVAANAGKAYVQMKSGKKWVRVSDDNTYAAKGTKGYYAFNPGSYRFVMKPKTKDVVTFWMNQKSYTASKATSKKKAQLMKPGQTVTNVLTASDKKGTTNFYKINLTKSKVVKVDFSLYQTKGKARVVLYGPGNENYEKIVSGSKVVSLSSDPMPLEKGTYYLGIEKQTKNTSFQYTIKYVK